MKKEALMETPLSREDIFHGRIFDVHKDRVALPDGRESTREVVHHKTGGVCVVPLTEDGKVYVVRQCRYPYHDILTEIPAGKLDPGEDPVTGAFLEAEAVPLSRLVEEILTGTIRDAKTQAAILKTALLLERRK